MKLQWEKWNGVPISQVHKNSLIEALMEYIEGAKYGCWFSASGETMFIAVKDSDDSVVRIYETTVNKIAYLENK
jgi:hypothetical protein